MMVSDFRFPHSSLKTFLQAFRVKFSGAKHSSADPSPPSLGAPIMKESMGYLTIVTGIAELVLKVALRLRQEDVWL